MGKPFRIAANTPPRDTTGRFTQMTAPPPPQVVDEARRTGKSVDVTVAEKRVPDHPVEKTTKEPSGGYQEQNPWPAAGPTNDGNRKPMRVG
jgi:hypothetical protein